MGPARDCSKRKQNLIKDVWWRENLTSLSKICSDIVPKHLRMQKNEAKSRKKETKRDSFATTVELWFWHEKSHFVPLKNN